MNKVLKYKHASNVGACDCFLSICRSMYSYMSANCASYAVFCCALMPATYSWYCWYCSGVISTGTGCTTATRRFFRPLQQQQQRQRPRDRFGWFKLSIVITADVEFTGSPVLLSGGVDGISANPDKTSCHYRELETEHECRAKRTSVVTKLNIVAL